MSTNKTQMNGSCFCGTVKFSTSGPSKWCAHCHCSMCRKTHGAGYVTWVGYEQQQFTFNGGEDHLTWFDSSPGAQRGFCRQCGSSMFFRSERWPGEIHIALGCVNGEIDRQPDANAFFDQHVGWMPIDESLKQVDG